MCARVVSAVRVLVADHYRVIRAGMRVMLGEARSRRRFEVLEAETGEEAVACVAAGGAEVVLVDYGIPGRGGPKTTELIRKQRADIRVLGMSVEADRSHAERMVAAGACGLILKNIEPDVLAVAIRTVMEGKLFYSNEVALQLLERVTLPRAVPLDRLTRTEKEVFTSILSGLIDREIADRMGIGKRTVDTHRQRLKAKLGVRNTVDLVMAGIRWGLVTPPAEGGRSNGVFLG